MLVRHHRNPQLGSDIGKNVCSVVGLDDTGAVVLRRRVRRDTLVALVGKLRACIVAMEACCGAHHLGRLFAAEGHDVRLMSPEYVRPYVKAQKNDDHDAEGIAEAATRPTMRFVALKNEAQLDMQTLHRARDRLVGQRTSLINQLRAILLERGSVVPQGKKKLERYLATLMDEHDGCGLSLRATHRRFRCRVRILGQRERGCATINIHSRCRRHNRYSSDRGGWQGRLFRAWSRPSGVARSGSSPVDHRRKASSARDKQARQQVPSKAVHPWRAGCTAARGRARYTVGPLGKGIAGPRSSECCSGGARQQARADRLGRAATRTTI
jgi:hypothetical protein